MRSKKLLALSTLITCLIGTGSVNAGLISGTHFTDMGKQVNLSGLEWLTWDLTEQSRYDVELSLQRGGSYNGFRYATRGELESLLDSLWGGTDEGWHRSNFDGANWLANTFHPNSDEYRYLYFGADGECSTDLNISCYGHYNQNADNGGWFQNDSGLSFGTSVTNSNAVTAKSTQFASLAHVLVRAPSANAVPEPSGLLLALSGVFLLVGFARKKRNK